MSSGESYSEESAEDPSQGDDNEKSPTGEETESADSSSSSSEEVVVEVKIPGAISSSVEYERPSSNKKKKRNPAELRRKTAAKE